METLEQTAKNFESLGFVRWPVISADSSKEFLDGTRPTPEDDEILYVKRFPNQNRSRSYQIGGTYDT